MRHRCPTIGLQCALFSRKAYAGYLNCSLFAPRYDGDAVADTCSLHGRLYKISSTEEFPFTPFVLC